jgi:hypothetical protein
VAQRVGEVMWRYGIFSGSTLRTARSDVLATRSKSVLGAELLGAAAPMSFRRLELSHNLICRPCREKNVALPLIKRRLLRIRQMPNSIGHFRFCKSLWHTNG